MLMMLKDILKTLAFSLIPAFIFAFLVILAMVSRQTLNLLQ